MSNARPDLRELQLTLTVDEVNLILKGVGRLPFEKVYPLVAKLQQQANPQLQAAPPSPLGGPDGQ